MALKLVVGCALGLLVSLGSAQASPQALGDTPPVVQPSVIRTLVICDQWQWIGNGAITWGCLVTPRRAGVAGGQTTDEVVLSLQSQINALRAELETLKRSQD